MKRDLLKIISVAILLLIAILGFYSNLVWRWYRDGTVQTHFVGERYSEKNMVGEIGAFR